MQANLLRLIAIAGLTFLFLACGDSTVQNSNENDGDSSSSSGIVQPGSSSSGGGASSGLVGRSSSGGGSSDPCSGVSVTEAEFCYNGDVYDKCDGLKFDPFSEFCNTNKVYDKCDGSEFSPATNFCYEDKLYAKCSGETYNPKEKGCVDGILYPTCLASQGGICVDESKVRCRQYEPDSTKAREKIIDPKPGLTCNTNNGKIEGTVKYDASKTYKTVQIGNQVWFAENLVFDPSAATYSNAKCYDDNAANCNKYGYLYDWATMAGKAAACNKTQDGCALHPPTFYRGICPNGWHLPEKAEWETLISYSGGFANAGARLKSASGWKNNGNGTDNYGFNVLPGGYYQNDEGKFESVEDYAYFWSLSRVGDAKSDYYRLYSADKEVRSDSYTRDIYLFSARCLQD